MKKTLIVIGILFFSIAGRAQLWIDLGVKGTFGLTMLYNSAIFNDHSYRYKFNTGFGFGGKLGLNFGDYNGLLIEGIRSTGRQDWTYNLLDENVRFTNSIKWTSIDLYTLYRFSSEKAYIELGPKFSFLQSVNQTDDNITNVTSFSDYYTKTLYSAAFGFGGWIAGNEVLAVVLGFRVDYSFSDFITEKGKEANYPNPNRLSPYDSYKPTHPLYGTVSLELNFGVGEYARAACGKRGFIFSFE